MYYKILGKTGLKVSELGFGGLQIPKLNEKEAIKLVREAYNLGINLFDTAHAYQNSEKILGKALKGIRDKVIISSKSLKTNKKEFINEFEKSLKHLNTDYIDIFLFHCISKNKEFNKLIHNSVVEALLKEKQKGKLKFIGFSCHNPKVINKYFNISEFSILMIPVNLVETEFIEDKSFYKVLADNIGILGMKPLGGGRIKDIELCFKYLRQYDRIIPIVGMKNIFELKENIEFITSKKSLSDNDIERVNRIREELGNKFCRSCSYCMPCPQGINIPRVNFLKISYNHYNIKKFLTPERTEAVKKVNECLECGKCEKKCPYSLNIVKILKENRDFYFKKLK